MKNVLNVIALINESGFELRDDHNGTYYYGKRDYDGDDELLLWFDEEGGEWRWVNVGGKSYPGKDGDLKANYPELTACSNVGEYFEAIEAEDKRITEWLKSIS
jgi:hypothetical protein